MQMRRPADSDRDEIPQRVATQVLARASELDAARSAAITVAQLRAAAVEAGISTSAFDRALAEVQVAEETPVPATSGSSRRWRRAWTIAGAVVFLLAAAMFARLRAPIPASAQTLVEETIVLRCLSPAEAAELVRPILTGPSATVTIPSAAGAPRVLLVRGTPAQLQQVKSTIDRHDGVGSPACATPASAAQP